MHTCNDRLVKKAFCIIPRGALAQQAASYQTGLHASLPRESGFAPNTTFISSLRSTGPSQSAGRHAPTTSSRGQGTGTAPAPPCANPRAGKNRAWLHAREQRPGLPTEPSPPQTRRTTGPYGPSAERASKRRNTPPALAARRGGGREESPPQLPPQPARTSPSRPSFIGGAQRREGRACAQHPRGGRARRVGCARAPAPAVGRCGGGATSARGGARAPPQWGELAASALGSGGARGGRGSPENPP